MELLLDAGQGLVRLVTLAPERDRAGQVTRFLVERGVLVAAGHTNATRIELQQAIDQGLSLFTHLGNACPMQMPRHDNIISRALSLRHELMFTLIADGVHVPDYVWRDWCEWIGYDRVILISDATAAAGDVGGNYRLGRQAIQVSGQQRSQFDTSSGLLAGSLQVLPDLAFRLQTMLPGATLEKLVYRNAQRFLQSESAPPTSLLEPMER
jgi:N-acetylglucosamine-6-phosphate deacetylase